MESDRFYEIDKFPSKLVHMLYGEDADQLFIYGAGIYLPPEGIWWPIGCRDGAGTFIIDAHYPMMTSRGVK